ncbi:hypothetical protein [Inhella gelatinilytica]|uniref:Uncharacterized protein n=1 Tax=Inhella gelatinilytica TaxID=2795030 RepID=A0A931NDJ1_9BURK|nr:hypothetical protein [Inhella gelatinilytica]MBH9552290.1 hypothetical protein [Inhella gelatinilytica]
MSLNRRQFCQAAGGLGSLPLAVPGLARPAPPAPVPRPSVWWRDRQGAVELSLPDLTPVRRLAMAGPWRASPTGLWGIDAGRLTQWGLAGTEAQRVPAAPGDRPLSLVCVSATGEQVLTSDGLRLHLWSTTAQRWVAHYPCPAQGVVAAAHPVRRSFVLAPQGVEALWEIYLDPQAEDFYTGTVHDFQFGEGVPTRGHLGLRPMPMPTGLTALAVHPQHFHVLARTRAGEALIVNLDARRPLRPRRAVHAWGLSTWCTWQGQAAWAHLTPTGFEVVGLDDAATWVQCPRPARGLVGQADRELLWRADEDRLQAWPERAGRAPIARAGAQLVTARAVGDLVLVLWRQAEQAWLTCHSASGGPALAETPWTLPAGPPFLHGDEFQGLGVDPGL